MFLHRAILHEALLVIHCLWLGIWPRFVTTRTKRLVGVIAGVDGPFLFLPRSCPQASNVDRTQEQNTIHTTENFDVTRCSTAQYTISHSVLNPTNVLSVLTSIRQFVTHACKFPQHLTARAVQTNTKHVRPWLLPEQGLIALQVPFTVPIIKYSRDLKGGQQSLHTNAQR